VKLAVDVPPDYDTWGVGRRLEWARAAQEFFLKEAAGQPRDEHGRYSSTGGGRPAWKPVMSRAEADRFCANSVVKSVMYHGTTTETATEILSNGFQESTKGALGGGVYLTSEWRQANYWATQKTTLELHKAELETRVNLEHPFMWNANNPSLKDELAEFSERARKVADGEVKVTFADHPYGSPAFEDLTLGEQKAQESQEQAIFREKMQAEFEKAGYDGIYVGPRKSGVAAYTRTETVAVAFDPHQIVTIREVPFDEKGAIGNAEIDATMQREKEVREEEAAEARSVIAAINAQVAQETAKALADGVAREGVGGGMLGEENDPVVLLYNEMLSVAGVAKEAAGQPRDDHGRYGATGGGFQVEAKHLEALRSYITNSWVVSAVLRGEEEHFLGAPVERAEKTITDLQALITAQPPSTEPLTVYKGIDRSDVDEMIDSVPVGGRFTDQGFGSASVDEKVAGKFTGAGDFTPEGTATRVDRTVVIELPAGSHYLNVPAFTGLHEPGTWPSTAAEEDERLLPHGTVYEVTGRNMATGQTYVKVVS
jgi:hypothetical protein